MARGGRGVDVIVDEICLRRGEAIDIPAIFPQKDLHSVAPEQVRGGPARIEWRQGHPRGKPGAPASDCLFNFLRLADAHEPDEFVQFAATHGVLGLTEKGFPGSYDGTDPPVVPDDPL